MNDSIEISHQPVLDPRQLARQLSNKLLIGGAFQAGIEGRTFQIRSPSTGEHIGDAAEATAQDVDFAVDIAKRAQITWARLSVRERGKLVADAGQVLVDHTEELARLIALETGKAIRTEARVEATWASDCFAFFGGLGPALKGETVPFKPNMLTITKREPIGVVAAILPWNAPLALMGFKIAPALVAGNSVIVKSAEEAPLCALRMVELLNRVLPPGVLNILSGDGPVCGAPLVAHPDVAKVTFTGSVETGKIIYRASAEKLAPVTLELGGKSPMIVMGDADIAKAVDGAVYGMRFTRQGQSCSAASRIFVHASVFADFVKRLRARVDALKMGDPLDESTDIGTIISRTQFDKVKGYIAHGREIAGDKAIACSALPSEPHLKDGFYVQPMLLVGVDNESRVAREEIFGPVTCIMEFTEYEDALRMANDTEFGLCATIWTKDLGTALDAADRLEAGYIQVNQNIVAGIGTAYGGYKSSGLGKELSVSSMLEHFTREKTIIFNMDK